MRSINSFNLYLFVNSHPFFKLCSILIPIIGTLISIILLFSIDNNIYFLFCPAILSYLYFIFATTLFYSSKFHSQNSFQNNINNISVSLFPNDDSYNKTYEILKSDPNF